MLLVTPVIATALAADELHSQQSSAEVASMSRMNRDVRGRIRRYYGVELRYVEYGVGRDIGLEM